MRRRHPFPDARPRARREKRLSWLRAAVAPRRLWASVALAAVLVGGGCRCGGDPLRTGALGIERRALLGADGVLVIGSFRDGGLVAIKEVGDGVTTVYDAAGEIVHVDRMVDGTVVRTAADGTEIARFEVGQEEDPDVIERSSRTVGGRAGRDLARLLVQVFGN